MSSFNIITLLSQLNPLIPLDTEPNNNWPAADRQLRNFLSTYLGVSLKDDGTLKAGSITADAIGDGTLNGAKLTDATVTGAKLVNETVDTAQIADGAIELAKLDQTMTLPASMIPAAAASTIADRSITAIKHVVGSLTGTVAANVATGEIARDTISAECLQQSGASAATPKLPVCAGNSSATMEITGDVVATVVGGKLNLALDSGIGSLKSYARFERYDTLSFDVQTPASPDRVALEGFYIDTTYASLYTPKVEVDAVKHRYFKFLEAGIYQIRARSCSYNVNAHRLCLYRKSTGTIYQDTVAVFLGCAEIDGYSELSCILRVLAANEEFALHVDYVESMSETPIFGFPTAGVGFTTNLNSVIEIVKL